METHLEIEFKILITETIYNQILADYQNQVIDQYEQINYYLMHPILDKKNYMLRIREKKERFELTLKQPTAIGNQESNINISKEDAINILNKQHSINPIFKRLEALDISINELDTTHFLTTLRTDIQHPAGILSLDKNSYNSVIDYELELEVLNIEEGKKAFEEIIDTYKLAYKKNCLSKIKRLKQSL